MRIDGPKFLIMFCCHCGAEINDNAVICVKCGCAVAKSKPVDFDKSEKNWLTTLLLCFFLGSLGIHRFYVGKTGTGILQLITCGGCGVWALIDFIVIAIGNFTDSEDKKIVNSNN